MTRGRVDFAGQEVACRTFGRIVNEWERRGRDLASLVEDSGVTVEQLRDKHARMSWAGYGKVLANARAVWDDEGFVDLGLIVMDSPWAKPFTIPARLLYSARDFYFAMSRPGTGAGIARRMFTCVDFRVEEVDPRHLVMHATMEEGYPAYREFFLITKGSLASLPAMAGLGSSRVEMQEIEGGFRYDIRLPAGGGMLGRLRRTVSWPFAARAAARELEGAYVELHESHVDLKTRVGERAAMEEERRRLIADLEHKNVELEARNAELERFTYTVSHDLRAPLVTIKGFLGLLEKDVAGGDAERVRRDIERISDATDHLDQLLGELLELSRVGRLVNPPEEVDLTELACEATRLLAGRIEERGVDVRVQPGMPSVLADRLRLLEVYQNLIENGIKFMGDEPNPRIEIGTGLEGDHAVAFVRDNGIGVEEAHLEKVFGLFNRLDQSVEGTGIGLALVRRIVEVHDGEIWAESEGQGRGTTFHFALPLRGAIVTGEESDDARSSGQQGVRPAAPRARVRRPARRVRPGASQP